MEDVETYKHEQPLLPCGRLQSYVKKYSPLPRFRETFKLSLLIITNTANVERGFSVLTMHHTKYCNSLSPNLLDKLMRLVLLAAPTLSDETWEALVD